MRLTLAFHVHKREHFQQRPSRTHTRDISSCQTDGRSSDTRTRWRGASARSCLWPVLTVSDRSRRVKIKKTKKTEKVCFAFQSVFVCICATESARNLLGVYSAPWPGLACPPTILWSCCWIGRLKMMHIEVLFFLSVGTQRQHCCRLFSLRLCLSVSETKFDFPSLTPLLCLHTCLLILPPSITRAPSPPLPGNNVRWPVWGGEMPRRSWDGCDMRERCFISGFLLRKTPGKALSQPFSSTRKVLTPGDLNPFFFVNVVLQLWDRFDVYQWRLKTARTQMWTWGRGENRRWDRPRQLIRAKWKKDAARKPTLRQRKGKQRRPNAKEH